MHSVYIYSTDAQLIYHLLRSPRNVLVVEKALGRSWPIHPKYQGWMDDLSRLIPRGVALKRIAWWKMVTDEKKMVLPGCESPR